MSIIIHRFFMKSPITNKQNHVNQLTTLLTCTAPLSTEHQPPPIDKPNAVTRHDLIGPADKISNLRKFKYYVPDDESEVEKSFRKLREHVNDFNHQYWTDQNLKFVEAKRLFVQEFKQRQLNELVRSRRRERENGNVTTENDVDVNEPDTAQMNEFYKNFLDENYYSHYAYNQSWIKYNLSLIWPAYRVFFYRLKKMIFKT